MLRRIALQLVSITTAILAATALAPAQPADREANLYRSHIEFLANPFMEGRGPGTRGNEIAAEYIEATFKHMSLNPVEGTRFTSANDRPDPKWTDYREPFIAGVRAHAEDCVLAENGRAHTKCPQIAFSVALGFSGSGSVTAPLVFVGYGIQNGGPNKSYNTFTEADDLSGRIAVLLRFEPMDEQGRSRWKTASDTLWSSASALPAKVQEVVKHKPAGLILVSTPGADDPRVNKVEGPEGTSRWMQPLDIPAVMVGPEAAAQLIEWTGSAHTIVELRKQADEHGGIIALGDKQAELGVRIERTPRATWNIAATLPGRGPLAEQYIIIGAHYDHVGYGYTGGSRSDEYGIVHPGADDNASGASGLLLAADLLKQRYDAAPADSNLRSIMFVAFSAEEMGLIGSREFMKACPIEAKSIDCMLNMDMIGRLRDNHLEVSGTGTAEGFADILQPLFASSGLSVQQSPGGRGPSDHATFYGAGIPVLHFFTGQHEQYHTPRDTVDLINVPGAVQVVHLVCDIAGTLARRPDQLAFKSTDKKGEKPDAPAGPTLGGLKVRFGIAPGNYADGEAGVLVGEVYPGTCAAEAGIQPGDRLIRWNGKDIGDVASWMTYLAEHKPGDTVDVDVKRKTEEIRVRVTLKSRDQAPK